MSARLSLKSLRNLIVTLTVLISLICFLNLKSAIAVDQWYPVNQNTIAWDASTTLVDGSPLPAGDTVTYYIYSRNEDGSNITALANTQALEYTVTVPADAKLIIGVSAARTMADGTVTDESTINWSDVAEGNQGGVTFGISNIRSAAAPSGLRRK